MEFEAMRTLTLSLLAQHEMMDWKGVAGAGLFRRRSEIKVKDQMRPTFVAKRFHFPDFANFWSFVKLWEDAAVDRRGVFMFAMGLGDRLESWNMWRRVAEEVL